MGQVDRSDTITTPRRLLVGADPWDPDFAIAEQRAARAIDEAVGILPKNSAANQVREYPGQVRPSR